MLSRQSTIDRAPHAHLGHRALIPSELAEVAGGYTSSAAASSAATQAANHGGIDVGIISPNADWMWWGDGNDNGLGGFAVYYEFSTGDWGYGTDTGGGGS